MELGVASPKPVIIVGEEPDADRNNVVASKGSIATWRGWDLLSLVLVGLSNVLMLVTFRDYGFTYDEPPHIRYGERILGFYASGFTARRALQTSYVGGFDLVAAMLRRISPFDDLVTNHALCIFVAQCGLLGAWKLGRLLGGPLGGLCSWLFLVLTPVYYSHQFNNPKDVPFAAGYVWGLYVIAYGLTRGQASSRQLGEVFASRKYFVQLGLALGLAMSVRVGGALLIGFLGLSLLAVVFEQRHRGVWRGPFPWKRPVIWLAVAFGIAWVMLLLFWPKALLSPVQGPAAAVESVTHYKSFDSPTLLRGKLVSSHHLPWDYLPTYFLVQLPEFTLGVLVLALGWWGLQTQRAWYRKRPVPLAILLVVMAVMLPPSYAIVRRSTLYDGLRHFLFIIPPLSVLCGVTLAELCVRLAQRAPRAVAVLGVVYVLFLGDQVHAMSQLHPYQHVYFNRTSGATKQAIKRYETEYYGALYQELGERVAAELWKAQPKAYLERSYRIAVCGSYLFVTRNFPLNFQYEAMGKVKRADLFATYPRDRCLERLKEYPSFVEIQRRGGTLGVARDLKGVLDREHAP